MNEWPSVNEEEAEQERAASRMEIHDPELDYIYNPESTALHEKIEQFHRTEAGELPNPRVEMREYEPEPKTAEDMAAQLGCEVSELADKLTEQANLYAKAAQELTDRLMPPKLNRAQRRARDKALRRNRFRG